jgi:hypothetical protein
MRISIANIIKYIEDDRLHSFVEDIIPHLLPESKVELLDFLKEYHLYNDANLKDEDIKNICSIISDVTGIINILSTTSRLQKQVLARHLFMYVCYCEYVKKQMMTYNEIGNLFYRHFHHSVVMYSVESMRGRYQIDSVFRKKIMIPIAKQIKSVEDDLSNVKILG